MLTLAALPRASAAETRTLLLSGTSSADAVDWEFKVSGGRRSGEWSAIPVPSNWEMQGFGTYRYHRDWGAEYEVPDKTGWYRHRFTVPADWQGARIDLVFGGVMTDTEAKLNGELVGPVHRGGFYEFRYEVTPHVRPGVENELEVTVDRYSADASVNNAERRADYWLFAGIYRPVWLEARPAENIAHVAIDARHDGAFVAQVRTAGIPAARVMEVVVRDASGAPLGSPLQTNVAPNAAETTLQGAFTGVRPWSAEWPHLYTAEFRLRDGDRVIHQVTQTFGFRTVEVRYGEGLFVNERPVRLRGVNRHSFWPTTGRTTTPAQSEADILLMKEMNMNAVRTSHYPPDRHFLEAADRLGLYVIDELGGWQRAYDTQAGTPLVAEMVARDVNHPAIILWSNGNEGGWNPALDDDFAQHDLQRRVVIHPWADFNGINTSHYEVYGCCTGWFFGGSDLILPTEFLHALYDGGGGAGLDDWWNLMLSHPLAIGGFLWAFADEGIVRADQDGKIDVAGNAAPDGVVGPFREKEGSFYAIKEIWSPVYLPLSELDRLPSTFTGTLRVENRYDFTDLEDVAFTAELRSFPPPSQPGRAALRTQRVPIAGAAVAPRQAGELKLALPRDWRTFDSLAVTAMDPHGREIYMWTWMVRTPAEIAAPLIAASGSGSVVAAESGDTVTLQAGDVSVAISRSTGQLASVRRAGRELSLKNGPRILDGEATLTGFKHFADGDTHVVLCDYAGTLRSVRWTFDARGALRLDYTYGFNSHAIVNYLGVTFDFDEADARSMRWLGKGPYRVWKNRLKGAEFGVWEKKFNNSVPGESWEYPEFKGFHDDVYWANFDGAFGPFTVVVGTDDLFVRLFTPADGVDPRFTHVEFPPGDLSFLHGIAPIGTKFHAASEHGPAGTPNLVRRHGLTASGTITFLFGAAPP